MSRAVLLTWLVASGGGVACAERPVDPALGPAVQGFCETEVMNLRTQAEALEQGTTQGLYGDVANRGVFATIFRNFIFCAHAHGAREDVTSAFSAANTSVLTSRLETPEDLQAAAQAFREMAKIFEQVNHRELIK